MKILGKINVAGVDVYQVNAFNPERDHIDGAKKGSFLYVDPLEVYEYSKKGEWIPSTFRIMFMNILSWGTTLLNSDEKVRKTIIGQVYDGILNFKQGKPSREGEELVKYLKNDFVTVGISPAISYLMPKERGEGSLETFWEHPFSIPTILLKHKKLPFCVLANGNLDYDDSRLIKMAKEGTVEVDEVLEGVYVFEKMDKIQGLTG